MLKFIGGTIPFDPSKPEEIKKAEEELEQNHKEIDLYVRKQSFAIFLLATFISSLFYFVSLVI